MTDQGVLVLFLGSGVSVEPDNHWGSQINQLEQLIDKLECEVCMPLAVKPFLFRRCCGHSQTCSLPCSVVSGGHKHTLVTAYKVVPFCWSELVGLEKSLCTDSTCSPRARGDRRAAAVLPAGLRRRNIASVAGFMNFCGFNYRRSASSV